MRGVGRAGGVAAPASQDKPSPDKPSQDKHEAEKASPIIVAIDGAGSDDLADNVAFNEFADRIGAEKFDALMIYGAPVRAAKNYIDDRLKQNPDAPIYILGYSAGGDGALELVTRLHDDGVAVTGLVTFDAHNGSELYGFKRYELTGQVGSALNFYQQNPVTNTTMNRLPGYPNPFQGGPVTCRNCHNANLTGLPVNHTDIVQYSLRNHENSILKVLGR